MINSLSFSCKSWFTPPMHLSLFPSNLTSPPSMALYIILFYFLAFTYPSSASVYSNETDKAVLVHFKSQISDSSTGALSSWNESLDFCKWFGVTCSLHHQRVIGLNLSNQNLVGTLSPFIGNLSFLRYLNLTGNSFHGVIPPKVGRLSRLRVLDMSSNSFQGVIPVNISRCFALKELWLNKNNLTGKIPSNLGSLSKLVYLFLDSNYISGKIPASVGNISSLEVIHLTQNHLVGEIPYSIGRLQNVTWLTLGQNNFTGVFPPPLYNLSNLEVLDLPANNFSGSLRHDFGLIFPNVQRLALGNNKFIGSIPYSLSNASKLYLIDLPFNNFLGTIPKSFGNLNLKWLNVFENSLGKNGIDYLSFITPLTNCSMLRFLDISYNQFGGDLPHAITNLSTNLYHLGLDALDISGSVPIDIGRLANLNVLSLSFNHLTGATPASIGMLSNLGNLFLETNKLSGMIPPSFSNLSQILLINLSNNLLEGSIPGSLVRCTSLIVLDVSNNNFLATIPKVILHLKSLQELVVSNNSLGGPLPSEIGDLEHLTLLDVSYNRFSGNIPRELGHCLTLEELYMQGNIFEGSIPDLSKLKGLKLIDLSRNNLSGEFPKDMVNLTSLQNFHLSFNDLGGEVPKQGIFKNAKVIEVFGNKNLCGGIRELNLKPCQKQKFEKPGKHLSWKPKLVIIIVSSFLAVAFFIISLFFIRKQKKRPSLSSRSIELYPKITYTELYNATSRFSSSNLIGIGNFGTVYKGLLNPGETLVAIKVLNVAQHGASRSFMAECQALSIVRHRNLLKILTVCSTSDYKGNDFQALVYDFMTHGSLDMWLHANGEGGQKNLSLLDRINIAFDVASALCYLHHECPTTVVHCDLKPSNVLLDDDMTAHVSDFGLARLVPESSYAISNQSSSIGVRGTIGYVAPEYGIGGQVSTSGDVYSFGILILEMFTGRRPTNELFKDGLNIQTFVKLSFPERVMDIVDQSISCGIQFEEASSSRVQEEWESQLATCLVSIIKVGLSCSEESPGDRVSMKEVVTKLQHIKEKFLRK